jgi:hypothetical protein
VTGEIVDLGTGCSLVNRVFSTFGDVTIGAAFRLHSAFPVGSVVSTSWSSVSATGPVVNGHTFVQMKDDAGRTLWQEFHDPGSGTGSRSVTLSNPTSYLEFGIGSGNNGSNITISWNGVSMNAAPCGPP